MVAAPKLQRLTVAEAVERYLRSVDRAVAGKSLAAATARSYAHDLATFVELAGPDTVLDDMTSGDVDDLILTYGSTPDQRYARPRADRTRSAATMARFRQSVSRLFTEALAEGWVEASPMPRTRVRPKGAGLQDVARRALPQSAAQALVDLDVPSRRRDQQLSLRNEFLLKLFVTTGPRVSEVCGADRADLEGRDDGTWWLRVLGKGAKTRWLPVPDHLVDLYREYEAEERPSPRARLRKDPCGELVEVDPVSDADAALVLTWRGLRMKPRDVQLMVSKASENLPVQVRRRVTPHGLRHTAATLLLASGAADIRTVKELLGHASIATTGVYLDTIAAELTAAVRAHPVTGQARTR